MSEWRRVELRDVAELSNGANFSKESFGSGLKILGVRDFGDRLVPDWPSVDEVDPSAMTSSRQLLQDGDLLFVRSNGNPALVGRSLLILGQHVATHSAFTIRARPDRDLVAPRFLAYQARAAHRAGTLHRGSGTNISNLNQERLGTWTIAVPDLPAQLRIVRVLSAFDELIEINARRIQLLENLARSLYREWFVRFRFPGHESVELVDSQLGLIPEGWEVKPCGEVLTMLGGGTPSKKEPSFWDDGVIPWFTPSDLTKASTRFVVEPECRITPAGLAKSSARLFPADSVLMTSRATLGVFRSPHKMRAATRASSCFLRMRGSLRATSTSG